MCWKLTQGCTGPDSYNPSTELSKQSVLVRTEQCFSSSHPLLFFLPVTQLPGQMSLSGSGKHVLLCLASVAAYPSWGRGCVTVVPGSRPWVSLLILQVLLGLSSSTLNDSWKHSWQRRTRALQCKSSALPAWSKTISFFANPPRTWCLGGSCITVGFTPMKALLSMA